MPEVLSDGQAVSSCESYRAEYDRLSMLLEVSESIALHRDLGELFHDLAERLATKMGTPGLCATTLRHSWATNALKNGMDSTTASIQMGHRDPATLIRNYQHLAQDKNYLTNAANSLPITIPAVDASLPAVSS